MLFTILDWPGTKWLLLILLFVMPVASLLTWAERRQSAMMQDRLGPNRANIGPVRLWGILHFVADAVKMIFKEDFVPEKAHKALFSLAPILSLAPVFIAFAIIPFGPTVYPHSLFSVLDLHELGRGLAGGSLAQAPAFADDIRLQVLDIEFGLLFYFAILTVANYGATLAGWASYNKWALLGGLRASSQMMSYEVTMGLSLMGVFLIYGTLEPGLLVQLQGPEIYKWGFLCQPLALVLFFTAAIAETKRAPFDLPEGEPEIIGYFVEYSGMRWGMFFLAEFIEIVFVAMIMTTVFFGGYHVPLLHADGFHLGDWVMYLPHILVVLLQLLAFGLKVVFFCWLQLAIRWTLPRFRPDQLMTLGWKRLLPLSLFNVMATALVVLWAARKDWWPFH
jgi:NADH-quinone oxidoreductase subunit H